MTQLVIRDLDDETSRKLGELAGRNGVTAEDQVKQLIRAATESDSEMKGESLYNVVTRLKQKYDVSLEEGEIERQRGGIREVDFG